MENTLLNYMNYRFGGQNRKPEHSVKPVGPVITISREVGCNGTALAQLVANELNKTIFYKQWQVVSKEVLSASARELKVTPGKVSRLVTTSEYSTFDEILSAFTEKYYKSSKTIIKTIREVIRNYSKDGCCIIVGRAGNIIASDLENSLHLRLVAPLTWRISAIAERKNMSKAEAKKYIEETEKEREIFRKYFQNTKEDADRFDLTIDISRFNQDNLVKLILTAFEMRGVPERFRKTVPYF